MTTNADVKKLILALNLKAERLNIKYQLMYKFDYSAKFKKMLCRTYIVKYNNNILVNNINITGGCVYVVKYLTEEMKLYVQE